MPQWLVDTYADAIQRLEAEEALRYAKIIAAGAGRLEKADHREYMRELNLISSGRQRLKRTSLRPVSLEQFKEFAGAIPGFNVQVQD